MPISPSVADAEFQPSQLGQKSHTSPWDYHWLSIAWGAGNTEYLKIEEWRMGHCGYRMTNSEQRDQYKEQEKAGEATAWESSRLLSHESKNRCWLAGGKSTCPARLRMGGAVVSRLVVVWG